MGLGRVVGLTSLAVALCAGAGCLYAGWDEFAAALDRKQPLEGVRKPVLTQQELAAANVPASDISNAPFQVASAANVSGVAAPAAAETTVAPLPSNQVAAVETPPVVPAPAPGMAIETEEDGDVTPTL